MFIPGKMNKERINVPRMIYHISKNGLSLHGSAFINLKHVMCERSKLQNKYLSFI